MYTAILLVVPIFTALINSAVMMMIVKIGVGMKSMVSEAIYRKALRLTSTAKGSTSTGQLVNIMSNDTNSLLMFMMMVTVIIMVPFMVGCSVEGFLCLAGHLRCVSCKYDGRPDMGCHCHLFCDADHPILCCGRDATGSKKCDEHHRCSCEADERSAYWNSCDQVLLLGEAVQGQAPRHSSQGARLPQANDLDDELGLGLSADAGSQHRSYGVLRSVPLRDGPAADLVECVHLALAVQDHADAVRHAAHGADDPGGVHRVCEPYHQLPQSGRVR